MIRTQIQLRETQMQALKRIATEQQISIAEVIRQAIDQFLQAANAEQSTWEETRRRALLAIGMFHSGLSDLSENYDEYFAQAIEEYPRLRLPSDPVESTAEAAIPT
jgi:metal-responsive CopG/Arc/MetJ family transcriptional regulator